MKLVFGDFEVWCVAFLSYHYDGRLGRRFKPAATPRLVSEVVVGKSKLPVVWS
jgi:hypothetical protein